MSSEYFIKKERNLSACGSAPTLPTRTIRRLAKAFSEGAGIPVFESYADNVAIEAETERRQRNATKKKYTRKGRRASDWINEW